MKQTAVKFFEDELKDKLGIIVINKNWELLEEIIEQAKAMEKEQIVKASSIAYEDMFGSDGTEYGEQYYNITFKSE